MFKEILCEFTVCKHHSEGQGFFFAFVLGLGEIINQEIHKILTFHTFKQFKINSGMGAM